MARCRSCPAEVWWATTEAGKQMPLDVQPAADGNVVIVERRPAGVLVRVLKKGEAPGDVATYKSHFATCPNARRHRRT